MYLKSIEVQGFKSFANKITFDFHEGITGIVGPNGSGKSNVADAVRWVLGEQRAKQLRGGSMQDVIFSGTELRKALSYAYVAITLDNSGKELPIDYEEVTIARRLYRSGESEYSINGTHCRLKDVNELFYDTGIGKEGYSIIGQGQIDQILSGKPEERRELFDEAAGIVKYKKRKNLSLKKLEAEKQNLVRVNDILSEIEKQVTPLEKQSNIAKEYLKKKDELRKFDINMFLIETARIKNEISELEMKVTNAGHELSEMEKSFESRKGEYSLAEEEIETLDESLEEAKSKLNKTHLLKQQLKGKINVLKEQINTLTTSDEHMRSRSMSIREEIAKRNENIDTLNNELKTLNTGLDEERKDQELLSDNLKSKQALIHATAQKVDEGKETIISLLNSRGTTRTNVQRYEMMLEQNQTRKKTLLERYNGLDKDNLELNEEKEGYEKQKTAIQTRTQIFLSTIKSVENEIRKLQEQITNRSNELQEAQKRYHREGSRLESLKNITERYDGYGNSIRRVMEKKDEIKGLLGVVADIVKTEKKYEVAVETALGGSIQNIVADTEETAKKMIAYLKQNKYGRATFLPLTTVKGSKGIHAPEALKEEGVIGLASELVTVEERYQSLAESILGRTIVVDHIDKGIRLAKKYRQSLRIVTLEGDVLNPGGAMTGGAFKNSSNLLSRRREIEELEDSVKKLRMDMKNNASILEEEKNQRTKLYAQLDDAKKEYQGITVQLNTITMNLEQSTEKLKANEERYLKIKDEIAEIDKQIKEIEKNRLQISGELLHSEESEASLTEEIEKLQSELNRLRSEESAEQAKIDGIQLKLVSFRQQVQFSNENLMRIKLEIEDFNAELKDLEANSSEGEREILQKEGEIKELEEAIDKSKDLFVELEDEVKENTEKKAELVKTHKIILEKREELSKNMAELDKEIFRLNNKREGCEESLEKNIFYMWEEYELTYNHALELKDPELVDLSYIKSQSQTLKSEIKALGAVNVNAIEDFKNMSERYIFLKTQRDDLLEAEATLIQIIEELDIAMREQFQSQFALIRTEYDKVFKQLFGGGKGTLEINEDEDILEAGIKIIAQPPGKKLQNMMQLSGGEKALTAISLLFAIQNLKPSPFCLLDEIEAALDDSNVVRFAKYLHKLTKHTQFIVITHRRGTMTSSDRLYGITMQEKGVSTLVSVDLLESEIK